MSALATLVDLPTAAIAALFPVPAHPLCRASVIIPARNEESGLAGTLDALRAQFDLRDHQLDPHSYEVLLLLNNCTDDSGAVARAYRERYPDLRLHIAEVSLPADRAHVGTARRLLMDAACERMEGQEIGDCAILSTDADTLVARDWVAANLDEIERGAEVVGGVIHLLPGDLDSLDSGTRRAYERDRRFQMLVAHLESLLDPDPADPWPRHLEHFGASLACTCAVYRSSGGLPAVKPLEDVAFIDALRKVGARIRHSPAVHIHTSARLDGRAEVGLSGQLRHWQRESVDGVPHLVDSCEWLEHRFRSLAVLRRLNESQQTPSGKGFRGAWRQRVRELHAERLTTPRFLELLDCDALIEESFQGAARLAEITAVCSEMQGLIRRLQPAPVRRAESARESDVRPASTPGD